jgi:hypothetical protein
MRLQTRSSTIVRIDPMRELAEVLGVVGLDPVNTGKSDRAAPIPAGRPLIARLAKAFISLT